MSGVIAFARRESVTVIRPAVHADVAQMVDMGRRFIENSEYIGSVGINPESMAATAHSLIAGESSDVLVAVIDNCIVGMLGLVAYVHPIDGARTAGELFWWVDPDHRGTLGVRLLRQAEKWARESGAERFNMIAPNAAVEQLYSRLGYHKVEVNYQLSLKGDK